MKNNFVLKWGLICVVIMAITLAISTRSHGSSPYERPDDWELEFWISQDVSDVDFNDYIQPTSSNEYLALGYKMAPGVDGRVIMPNSYVLYKVDSDKITGIEITDPSVEVYGLTIKSSPDEFEAVFDKMGFLVTDSVLGSQTVYRADKGRIYVTFCENRWITIDVNNLHL